ncbi:MAG: protein BatD [Verrucomicrobia bacterium]|nr:protein BatD [Verrucomicrobiota bacterium]
MERQSCETNFTPRARDLFKLRRAVMLVFLLLKGVLIADAASLKATLDRETVVVGETLTLTLQFEDVQVSGSPNLPTIPGLNLVESSTSLNTTIINGQRTSVQSFIYSLAATQPGNFDIPAFKIEVNGEKLSSAPLKVKILRQDPAQPPSELATNLAFLWLVLPQREFFVGQAFVCEVRLYLGKQVGNIDGFQPPTLSGDGISAGKPVQGQQFKRTVGGAPFTVIPLSYAVAVIKTGPLFINPIDATANLYGGRQDFFGRYTQSTQARLATEKQNLTSLPLPSDNIPAEFSGAIGNFTMTASIGPTNVAAGDPITVRVQISGRGALDAINLKTEDSWHDFKSYPPTSKVEVTDQFGLQGRKTFEQIVSPENTDIKELPAFSFSYFDPDAKSYRTLTHPATRLIVRPGGTAVAPVIAANKNSREESPQAQIDIVPIKQRPGTLVDNTTPLAAQTWFIALNAVPVLAFIGAFAWRRSADSLANNPRLRRRRQVEQTMRNGLVELRQLAGANKSDDFFALLFRLLQEQLGERLDCPATAITEAVIDEKLRSDAVPETTRGALHELFQSCNLARYAPVRSATELASHLARFETTLSELRRSRP